MCNIEKWRSDRTILIIQCWILVVSTISVPLLYTYHIDKPIRSAKFPEVSFECLKLLQLIIAYMVIPQYIKYLLKVSCL